MPVESLGGLAAVVGLLGLCVGSFLNVVAHRLPKVLERQWWLDVAENQLGTESFATSAIIGGRIYHRAAETIEGERKETLYCIE